MPIARTGTRIRQIHITMFSPSGSKNLDPLDETTFCLCVGLQWELNNSCWHIIDSYTEIHQSDVQSKEAGCDLLQRTSLKLQHSRSHPHPISRWFDAEICPAATYDDKLLPQILIDLSTSCTRLNRSIRCYSWTTAHQSIVGCPNCQQEVGMPSRQSFQLSLCVSGGA